MGRLLELGRRVQIQPMDAHCHDITVSLYQNRDSSGRPCYLFHSYSHHPEAAARLAFLAEAAAALAGMVPLTERPHALRWPCGAEHLAATRRLFVEVLKLPGPDLPARRPPVAPEARSGATFRVAALGAGRYLLTAEGAGDMTARVRAVAGGFGKLAEMAMEEGAETVIGFPCGAAHDTLAAMLLPRALNVRAALRDEEAALARGLLLAPSAQAPAP